MNIGRSERFFCLALGGVLLAAAINRGLRRVKPGVVGLALAGGALLSRGVTGHCPAYAAIGVDTRGLSGSP